jgi:F-type H+-transporting ATPase subunit delta
MADDRTTAYAEALFAVARAEGPLAEIEDELFRVAQVVKGNDELRDKLADPHIPVAVPPADRRRPPRGKASPPR